MLLQLGCELAQGYGIARPMPATDFPAWASAWQPDAAWSRLQAVSRGQLPLLFAGVEHRASMAFMEHHCMDERNMPLPPDFHRCRFGLWLETEGQARYGAQAVFKNVESVHLQLHELAMELCELREREGNVVVLARRGELHELLNHFLSQLKVLVQENRQ